jgi:hypothetical protein
MMKKVFKVKSNEGLEYNINRAFLGIFAVIIGLIFLINNLNLYYLSVNFISLWSLFIVFIGLSFFKKKNAVSTIVGSIVTIICAFLFFYSLALSTTNIVSFNTTPIVVTKDMNMERAEIELDAGGGEVNVYATDSDNLIEGKLITSMMESEINQSINESIQKVNISLYGKNGWMTKRQDSKNKFNIGIDKNVPVNFVFNGGGSSNTIDLSEVKAESVKINTGASTLSLKVGDSVNSSVIVEAGASSIKLNLPETVGVRMKIESGFSSQELPGFSLINDNTYQSLNYDSKDKKIDIDITMGMTSLSVGWYAPVKKNEISLFYYNQLEDKKNTCSVNYILPVKRCVLESDNKIKETIELLIEGRLTEKEKSEGFTTEFPNKSFRLLNSTLKDGTLTLEFSEVPGFTTGGSCRVKILGSGIIRTAKQFPEVKKVVLEPETLFEP